MAVYYSTFSHCWKQPEKRVKGKVTVPGDSTYTPENPRFRIVLPLSRSVNADEHALLVLGVKSIIPPELTECIDQSCFERARIHYLPSCLPEHESYSFSGHKEGQPLDVERFLRIGGEIEAPAKPAKQKKPVNQDSAFKTPLPAETADTANQEEPFNGKKKTKIENWFYMMHLHEFSTDAWRALNKNSTAVMVLIICRGKSSNVANDSSRKSTSAPTFEFMCSEAERVFRITKPTFIKAMALIQEIGFIEKTRDGKYHGKTPTLYRLSNKWKSYQQPESDNANMTKARLMRGKTSG